MTNEKIDVAVKRLKNLKDNEKGINDIVNTTEDFSAEDLPFDGLEMAQSKYEIKKLAEVVKNEVNPKTVVEIGTCRGGTFYLWTRYFNNANHFVSIDLPGGDFGGGYPKKKLHLFNSFTDEKLTFIRKDSHKPEIQKELLSYLSRPIDFLFIDGDHSFEGVKKDFEMYSPYLSEDGLVAFHDIADWSHIDKIQVNELWSILKEKFKVHQITNHSLDYQKAGGIGYIFAKDIKNVKK